MSPATLTALYVATPDAWPQPRTVDLVTAYVTAVRRAFDTLPYRIAFTAADPYTCAEHQRDAVRSSGILCVYQGGSDGLPWAPVDNWRMRAVHDAYDHLGPDGAGSFGFAGELDAFRRAADRMGDAFAPLLWSEIVLQAAYCTEHGTFAPQKLALLSPHEVDRWLR